MDSLPVTLIVKAPNQQIEDQKIRCETSWTINKLKQHLSEVYPSKPPHHEQKLIYSGQLLNDSVVLKDVLRQYDDQDTHTVHLVCTPKLSKMSGQPKPANQPPQVQENPRRESAPTVNQAPQQQDGIPVASNGTGAINMGVPENGMPWMNFNGQQVAPAVLNQYQLQMALMQQAYMQYMAQYMAQWSTAALRQQYSIPSPAAPALPVNQPEAQPNQPDAAQQNAAIQLQQDNEERDWLDIFYLMSRLVLLLSVVYFYSSPVRFIFVALLFVVLYLYQSGLFRNINLNNNHINGLPEGAQPLEEQAPTRLMVAWTFITTFFASLIPEIPTLNA